MATVEVHDVPDDVLARLRARADEAHQSLQGYLKTLLDREAGMLTMAEAARRAEEIASGSGVTTDDILAAIEEERARHE
ncbi:hypothetical protein [Glycomyces sp. NRRL B-16210]|uniref:FitA-like ribbon-helix-helix domain-containing protein n=1 Tax=Glycomyces sp. NRRL B-16210 TaxID=1463821 RepID=UPI0004BEB4D4|nr:hypothetical protein [Glycomyces sp. NRRL B-16210]